MQITDINQNLLQPQQTAATKIASIENAEGFIDLLQLADEGKANDKVVMATADSYHRQKPVSVKVLSQDRSDARGVVDNSVKNQSSQVSQSTAKQDNRNNTVDKKSSAKETKSPAEKEVVEKKEINQSAKVASDSQDTDTATTINVLEQAEVDVSTSFIGVPEVPVFVSEQEQNNTVEFASDIVVDEEVSLNPNATDNLLEVLDVNNVPSNTEDTNIDIASDLNVNAEAQSTNAQPEIDDSKKDNVSVEVSAPNPVMTEEAEYQYVAVEDSKISQQEEKIAAKLPEDSKIKIEVQVKQDVVNNDVNVSSMSDSDYLSDITLASKELSVEDNQVAEATSIVNQPQSTVSSADESMQVASIAPVNYSSDISSTDVANDNSSIVAVNAGETIKQTVTSQIRNNEFAGLKDFENQGLTREVAEQVKVNITQSAIKGVDKIEIQLKPAALGQLEIKMQIGKDGRLHAHIIASNADTMELLQKDLGSLRDAFNNAGYQTSDDSFSFSYQGEQKNQPSEAEQLRAFVGEVIEQDIAEAMASNDYVGADGVNIRV